MSVFRGIEPWHTDFISGIQISFCRGSSAFGTQRRLTHPPVKSWSFSLLRNHVSQGLLFCNVLALSCLGCLWFGAHPCCSLDPCVYLSYLRCISVAGGRRFAEWCSAGLWLSKPNKFEFSLGQNFRKQYYDLRKESPWLRVFYCTDNIKFWVL